MEPSDSLPLQKEYETMLIRHSVCALCAFAALACAAVARADVPLATIPLDGQPTAAALSTATGFLYVAESGTDMVLVYDTRIGHVVQSIPVDADPVDLAVDASGNRVFVACYAAGTLDIIDGSSNTVTARVALGAGLQPNGVAWNPTTGLVYTADSVGAALSAVDPVALTVNNIAFSAATVPGKVAVDPSANLIYVTDTLNQQVLQLDALAYTVTPIATNVPNPYAIAIDTATQLVYVCDVGLNQADVISETSGLVTSPSFSTGPQGYNIDSILADAGNDRLLFASAASDVVGVIDASTDTYLIPLPLPGSAWGVALDPAVGRIYGVSASTNGVRTFDATSYLLIGYSFLGSVPVAISSNPAAARAYVADSNLCALSVLDSSANALLATAPVGRAPVAVAVNRKSGMVYVANQADNTISVLDGTTNMVVATLPVGNAPSGIGTYDAINLIAVANSADGTVTLIDGYANVVTGTVIVGSGPAAITVDQSGGRAFVVNTTSASVSVVDLASQTVIATISTGSAPVDVAYDPQSNRLFVTLPYVGYVAVVDGATYGAVRLIPEAGDPLHVTTDAEFGSIYVSNSAGTTLHQDDKLTYTYTSTIPAGLQPMGMAIDNVQNVLLATNSGDGTVSVIGSLAPTTITEVAATNIVVQWNPPPPPPAYIRVVRYHIVKATGSMFGDYREIASLPAVQRRYVDRNVQPGQTYYYRVQTEYTTPDGAVADSGFSDVASATVPRTRTTLHAHNAGGLPGHTVTLRAGLFSKGAALPDRRVTFSLLGSVVGTAITDGTGIAAVPYAIPVGVAPGGVAITASFAGDATYAPSTGQGTLTIR